MAIRPLRMYNPKEDIYGNNIYGTGDIVELTTTIDLKYCIKKVKIVTMISHFKINARYKSTVPTIEDIYSYSTSRFMRMGCLDGPAFPYLDRSENV